MYLYANRAGWDLIVPIKLSENLLLNLRIVFQFLASISVGDQSAYYGYGLTAEKGRRTV
jgi:hypothetical protein